MENEQKQTIEDKMVKLEKILNNYSTSNVWNELGGDNATKTPEFNYLLERLTDTSSIYSSKDMQKIKDVDDVAKSMLNLANINSNYIVDSQCGCCDIGAEHYVSSLFLGLTPSKKDKDYVRKDFHLDLLPFGNVVLYRKDALNQKFDYIIVKAVRKAGDVSIQDWYDKGVEHRVKSLQNFIQEEFNVPYDDIQRLHLIPLLETDQIKELQNYFTGYDKRINYFVNRRNSQIAELTQKYTAELSELQTEIKNIEKML